MPKNIIVCCDGTGNEVEANLSNVLKLYRIVRRNEDQVVFYHPGVGTISDSEPWSRLKSDALGVWGLVTGYGLDEDQYKDGITQKTPQIIPALRLLDSKSQWLTLWARSPFELIEMFLLVLKGMLGGAISVMRC